MGSFPHECEAMELFTASVHDPAFFSQPARNRVRQGVVPDFLLQPPSGRQDIQELMEVKTLSFCTTRYPANILDTGYVAHCGLQESECGPPGNACQGSQG